MKDREITLQFGENERETVSERAYNCFSRAVSENKEQKYSEHSHDNQKIHTKELDPFVDKITEKLTAHIQHAVQKEIGNTETVSHIQEDLHCKICSKLMHSKGRTPVLLFPCGQLPRQS